MTGHIYIYGEIGTKTGQVSQKSVKEQVDKSADDYVVHIFSPGGDVFEGYGIYNVIKNDTGGKPVTAHIEGLCASIATLVVTAANRIVMNRTGQFMIHNPHISDLKGDANILRQVAGQLDQIKSILINAYTARTGLPYDKLSELYDNETYLTADQAAEMGFIDESVDALKAVASLDITKFKMTANKSILAGIRQLFTPRAFEKFKNAFTETLSDGRVIVVQSDTEDWTGKPVVMEDGSALPDGEYELSTGKKFTVADGKVAETAAEAAAPATEDKPEDAVENKKIKELEAKLVEAQAALDEEKAAVEASKKSEQSIEARLAKFEAKMKDNEALQSEYLKLKEKYQEMETQMKATFGEKPEPGKGPVFKNAGDAPAADPMGEEYLRQFKSRGIILPKR